MFIGQVGYAFVVVGIDGNQLHVLTGLVGVLEGLDLLD